VKECRYCGKKNKCSYKEGIKRALRECDRNYSKVHVTLKCYKWTPLLEVGEPVEFTVAWYAGQGEDYQKVIETFNGVYEPLSNSYCDKEGNFQDGDYHHSLRSYRLRIDMKTYDEIKELGGKASDLCSYRCKDRLSDIIDKDTQYYFCSSYRFITKKKKLFNLRSME
jgi:hypothetical protein